MLLLLLVWVFVFGVFFNQPASSKRWIPGKTTLIVKSILIKMLFAHRTEFIAKISKGSWNLPYEEIKLILCMHLLVGPPIEVIIVPC